MIAQGAALSARDTDVVTLPKKVFLLLYLGVLFALSMMTNYFDVYHVFAGISEIPVWGSILLLSIMVLAATVAMIAIQVSLTFRAVAATVFLLLFSAWKPIFSALPNYVPLVFGTLIILVVLVNERIRHGFVAKRNSK